MNIAKMISILGLVAMTVVIVYAFAFGNFAAEGAWIASHPWGIVSLVDLYVGFAIFSMWIAYREKSRATAIVWIALMMVLGNWTAALYVLLALNASRGDWKKFWMGQRAQ
ncbi:MAG: DUF1475 domain-containing protein [Anaerolineales bacterium]|nr:DUF1475 domain-containing protein [Anaerolineales bacterium]